MIIFDLDGTLADCEHRRHFVDPEKNPDYELRPDYKGNDCGCGAPGCLPQKWFHKEKDTVWKPKWNAFYEACDQDKPIKSTTSICKMLRYAGFGNEIHIWSGRCFSTFKKTDEWLAENELFYDELKMRPIGDTTPDDKLKEQWLDERIEELTHLRPDGLTFKANHDIDFVFDSDPKSIEIWKRRGVFVFDCNQG